MYKVVVCLFSRGVRLGGRNGITGGKNACELWWCASSGRHRSGFIYEVGIMVAFTDRRAVTLPMGIGSQSWGQKSRGVEKAFIRVNVRGMQGVGVNRWDTATKESHLPRLSVSMQPQVCGKNGVCDHFLLNEMRVEQINITKPRQVNRRDNAYFMISSVLLRFLTYTCSFCLQIDMFYAVTLISHIFLVSSV